MTFLQASTVLSTINFHFCERKTKWKLSKMFFLSFLSVENSESIVIDILCCRHITLHTGLRSTIGTLNFICIEKKNKRSSLKGRRANNEKIFQSSLVFVVLDSYRNMNSLIFNIFWWTSFNQVWRLFLLIREWVDKWWR